MAQEVEEPRWAIKVSAVEHQCGLSRHHYFEHYDEDNEFSLGDMESDADEVPSTRRSEPGS